MGQPGTNGQPLGRGRGGRGGDEGRGGWAREWGGCANMWRDEGPGGGRGQGSGGINERVAG